MINAGHAHKPWRGGRNDVMVPCRQSPLNWLQLRPLSGYLRGRPSGRVGGGGQPGEAPRGEEQEEEYEDEDAEEEKKEVEDEEEKKGDKN